jgi:hypothetical protein
MDATAGYPPPIPSPRRDRSDCHHARRFAGDEPFRTASIEGMNRRYGSIAAAKLRDQRRQVLLNKRTPRRVALTTRGSAEPHHDYTNRTAWIGGKVCVTPDQLSPWSSLIHKPPVVEPNASLLPLASIAIAWR